MTNSRTAPRSAAWLTIGPADQPAESAPIYVQRLIETTEARLPRADETKCHLGADIGTALSAIGVDDAYILGAALACYGRNVEMRIGRGMAVGIMPADPSSGLNLSTDEPEMFESPADACAHALTWMANRSAYLAEYAANLAR